MLAVVTATTFSTSSSTLRWMLPGSQLSLTPAALLSFHSQTYTIIALRTFTASPTFTSLHHTAVATLLPSYTQR